MIPPSPFEPLIVTVAFGATICPERPIVSTCSASGRFQTRFMPYRLTCPPSSLPSRSFSLFSILSPFRPMPMPEPAGGRFLSSAAVLKTSGCSSVPSLPSIVIVKPAVATSETSIAESSGPVKLIYLSSGTSGAGTTISSGVDSSTTIVRMPCAFRSDFCTLHAFAFFACSRDHSSTASKASFASKYGSPICTIESPTGLPIS